MGRVVREGPHLVVIHVRPDARITVASIQEVIQARHRLAPGVPVAMYFVASGELEWELAALQADHFALEGDSLKALAVMVDAPVFSTVVNMYFSLFPSTIPTRIVSKVEDGYTWLAEQGIERH